MVGLYQVIQVQMAKKQSRRSDLFGWEPTVALDRAISYRLTWGHATSRLHCPPPPQMKIYMTLAIEIKAHANKKKMIVINIGHQMFPCPMHLCNTYIYHIQA